MDLGKTIKNAGITVCKCSAQEVGSFDRTAIAGLVILILSFALGIITRNSAYITDQPVRVLPLCDTYISWLCIPTAYVTVPLGPLGLLVVNLTSSLSTIVLFVLGVVLVRK